MHVTLPRNKKGRDFVVGDIHGQYDLLQSELRRVDFNPASDRLFSVGDIIDKGPDSLSCLGLLDEPWFHMVRGNHEQMMIDCLLGKQWQNWRREDGRWSKTLEKSEAKHWAKRLRKLPVAITVKADGFTFGLCHAEPDGRHWKRMRDRKRSAAPMMWGRRVLRKGRAKPVRGVDLTLHGHTPLDAPRWIGNRYFMDTGAGHGGPLTLRDVADIHAELTKKSAS